MNRAIFRFAVMLLALGSLHAQTLKLGVISPRGEEVARKKWTPLAKAIGRELDRPIQLVVLSPEELIPYMVKVGLDLVLTNPVLAVHIKEKFQVQFIATLEKKSGYQFGGVIVANPATGITKSTQLKGKRVLAYKIGSSAGAYVFQTYHLMQQGIGLDDLEWLRETESQDEVVYGVAAGNADAGFVRTGILEGMLKEGKIKEGAVVVVDRKDSAFHLAHSTSLYPE